MAIHRPTKSLCIDFDGVIHDKLNPIAGRRMGPPLPDAKDALTHYNRQGHTIIIHSVMANTPSGKQAIADWMAYYGLPFNAIEAKPYADYYIDDKAVKHTSWSQTLNETN